MTFNIFQQQSDTTWNLINMFSGTVIQVQSQLTTLQQDGHVYHAEYQENAQTVVVDK